MFEIQGLNKLQRELDQAQRALDELDGELGTVQFDPHDPASIETAIQSACQMIDSQVGQYSSNPIIGPLIDQIKESYRENIVQKAAEARLQVEEDE
ncbi:hypothetical protein QX25_02790 [Stutzerimonas stutzeri]|uniref:Uncharacterized protein n=1 Tax=Stutzerimonas balearica TaxID=74829 RepID=A0A9X7V340_9GAMM|nr:hypothetical protein [Stutzerimonas balearica]KIL05782.1 hypothetical protein QX25_02790 [Stutzerimonas stutzeri]QQN51240.1 hypothetical protein I6H70_01850 [Stutzerimonas balearica]